MKAQIGDLVTWKYQGEPVTSNVSIIYDNTISLGVFHEEYYYIIKKEIIKIYYREKYPEMYL